MAIGFVAYEDREEDQDVAAFPVLTRDWAGRPGVVAVFRLVTAPHEQDGGGSQGGWDELHHYLSARRELLEVCLDIGNAERARQHFLVLFPGDVIDIWRDARFRSYLRAPFFEYPDIAQEGDLR